MPSLGQRIRQLREGRGLTQEQLAARVGGRCSKATIAHYERGRTSPSHKRAGELAAALGVTRAKLYAGVT